MDYSQQKFEVIRYKSDDEILSTDITVVFIIDGILTVVYQDEKYTMKKEDLLLISPGIPCVIECAVDNISAIASYNISFVARMTRKRNSIFYVNSMADAMHSYRDIKQNFLKLTNEFAVGNLLRIDIYLLELLEKLEKNYQITAGQMVTENGNSDVRMQEIMQYITANLDKEINLTEIAENMYLSTSTLSRIFKKNTGVYFVDYVMNLRVKSALSLLTYTEQSLTQIALSCGFSNASTFSRSFVKIMKMTPSEYRGKMHSEIMSDKDKRHTEDELLRSSLMKMGYGNSGSVASETIEVNASDKGFTYSKNWDNIMNIGSFSDLMNANMQYHTEMLVKHFHFNFVRLWNPFSVKMMITDGNATDCYNFAHIDQILDFIVGCGCKPFIDFGRRPQIVLRSTNEAVYVKDDYTDFASKRNWQAGISAFVKHIVSRYGLDEASEWIFELTQLNMSENEDANLYSDDKYCFYEAYSYFYREIRFRIPKAKLGAKGGSVLRDYSEMQVFLKRCRSENQLPDFVSYTVFPYDDAAFNANEDKRIINKDATEERQIYLMKEIMDKSGTSGLVKLFISEWNYTISNRNILNDSCFRATYILQKLEKISSEVDEIAMMAGSDWISSYTDTVGLVHGGIGFVTREGIKKPVFHAMDFARHLGRRILSKGNNHIATIAENGEIIILCFYHDSFMQESSIDKKQSLGNYIRCKSNEDFSKKNRISIKGFSAYGEYCIRQRILNMEHGSLIEEWEKFQFDKQLSRQDIKYLESMAIPKIEQKMVNVTENEAEIEMEFIMLPNEVRLIQVFQKQT